MLTDAPMNPRERLMATLRGEAVDRPAVSFYELNGHDQDPDDPDSENIYNHPSWRPLLDLARDRTDRIVRRNVVFTSAFPDPVGSLAEEETTHHDGSRFTRRRIPIGDRTLTSVTRRDPDINTVWVVEHLLKGEDDLKAFLDLPEPVAGFEVDPEPVVSTEAAIGDRGIVMVDSPDPLCLAAEMFHMADYTVIALTEPALFHRLLERFASVLLPRTEAVARALPGRHWRIFGPEYASPPFLPPRLFREYVCRYVQPMIEIIKKYGGFPRIHCHGNIRDILDDIAGMGADGLDPIEPPPQGNVSLAHVRERVGRDMVLFGNLEANDIENLPTDRFAEKVKRALNEGTAGPGRGFVLMPAASPYGRELPVLALRNYEKMVELVERF